MFLFLFHYQIHAGNDETMAIMATMATMATMAITTMVIMAMAMMVTATMMEVFKVLFNHSILIY